MSHHSFLKPLTSPDAGVFLWVHHKKTRAKKHKLFSRIIKLKNGQRLGLISAKAEVQAYAEMKA